MRKAFICSLCHNGILGGALYVDESAMTYRTQKLTVAKEYRNLVLPLREIEKLSWAQIIFPVATITMADGREYRFLIFNKTGFQRHCQQLGGM